MEFPAVWAVIAAGWTKKGQSSASDAIFAQTQHKMRGIVQGFRAFSRFTEADACTLLSLYGLCAIEVDRLQNSRVQDERGAGDTAENRKRQRTENVMKTPGSVLAVMTFLTLNTNAGTQEQLEACRRQIDSLDQRIVELVQERARMVEQVGNIKREAHLPVAVPSREQQVIAKVQELAKGGPLPAEAVGRIYEKLVEEMRNWEAELNAAATTKSSGFPSPK